MTERETRDEIENALKRMEEPNGLDVVRVRSFFAFWEGQGSRAADSLRAAAEKDAVPIIRRDTEDLLSMLVKIAMPKRILEIGTATGFSSFVMIRSNPDALIDTVEIDCGRAEKANAFFESEALSDRITVHTGDALSVVPELPGPYGFVFLDGAKSEYRSLLPMILDRMQSGSILFTDNLFEKGETLDPRFGVFRRNRTIRENLRAFLRMLKEEKRLETSLLNVGDGVAVSRMV